MHNKIEITVPIIKSKIGNFKLWRNKTKDFIRSAKKGFFENAINENRDSLFLLKHVKDITGRLTQIEYLLFYTQKKDS